MEHIQDQDVKPEHVQLSKRDGQAHKHHHHMILNKTLHPCKQHGKMDKPHVDKQITKGVTNMLRKAQRIQPNIY